MLWQTLAPSIHAPQRRQQLAIVSEQQALTYEELDAAVNALAAVLKQQGFGNGNLLLGYLPNEPAFIVAMLACNAVGCAFAPLDVGVTPAEADWYLALTQANGLLCLTDDLLRCRDWTQCQIAMDACGQISDVHGTPQLAAAVAPDTACVQFTSGSTGRPKGILLKQDAFLFRCTYLVDGLGLTNAERTLCTLPLSHTHGSECLALPTLMAGGTLYLMSPALAFPLLVLSELERLGITFFSAIPQFYDFAVKLEVEQPPDLQQLRLAFCGSAALSVQTAAEFFGRYGIHIQQGYGLAELSVICVNRHDEPPLNYRSIGKPLPGVDVRVDSQLRVRSRALFSGYLRDPVATAAKLKQGWLDTGDVVIQDEYERFHIVGRCEDFIKVNGFKVYVAEVEQAIMALDWIQACVVLIERTPTDTEQLVAHVELAAANGNQPNSNPTLTLQRALRASLSDFKIPRHCIVHKQLPRNPLGKILRQPITHPPLESGVHS